MLGAVRLDPQVFFGLMNGSVKADRGGDQVDSVAHTRREGTRDSEV